MFVVAAVQNRLMKPEHAVAANEKNHARIVIKQKKTTDLVDIAVSLFSK